MKKLWLYVDESDDGTDWWTIWKTEGPVEITDLMLMQFKERKWPEIPVHPWPLSGKYRRHRFHEHHWTFEQVTIKVKVKRILEEEQS